MAEAIRRELLREGQVFFVHNRVQDIEHVAERLRELVPEARVAVAHGQMDEGTLEQVVLDFWEGEYDVLVCTTIIESGIDMPTVNTLVVDRADLLGLGQLHQLRGRVGRAGQRAYAYLFYPPERVAVRGGVRAAEDDRRGHRARVAASRSPCATSRSAAPATCSATGQSGHIAAVGYDLYCQMVTEAVAELKGEPVREPAEIKLDLPLDAHLPEGLRGQGGPAARGVPPAGRGHHRGRGRRHPRRVGRPLRAGAARRPRRCSTWPGCGPSAPASASARSTSRRARASAGPACIARLTPLALKVSQEIRLKRLVKGAVYKEEIGQVQLPVCAG